MYDNYINSEIVSTEIIENTARLDGGAIQIRSSSVDFDIADSSL